MLLSRTSTCKKHSLRVLVAADDELPRRDESMRARFRFETWLADGVVPGDTQGDVRQFGFRIGRLISGQQTAMRPSRRLRADATSFAAPRYGRDPATMRPSGANSHTIHRNTSTLFWPFRDALRFCAMRTPSRGVGWLYPTCDCLRVFHRYAAAMQPHRSERPDHSMIDRR